MSDTISSADGVTQLVKESVAKPRAKAKVNRQRLGKSFIELSYDQELTP